MDLNHFNIYINKRPVEVPLGLLYIEEIMKSTPSVILDESVKHNYDEESQEKLVQGLEDSEHQSHNDEESPEKHPEKDTKKNGEETTEKAYVEECIEIGSSRVQT